MKLLSRLAKHQQLPVLAQLAAGLAKINLHCRSFCVMIGAISGSVSEVLHPLVLKCVMAISHLCACFAKGLDLRECVELLVLPLMPSGGTASGWKNFNSFENNAR